MTADAIVIGAGIVGSTIAWRLRQRGASVVLLDAGRLGGEATWAAAGMLAPGGEICERSIWLDLALDGLRLYPEYVAELEEASGYSIDYQRKGAVEVALTDDELATLETRASAQGRLGIPSEPVNPADFGVSGPEVLGGRFFPNDALVNPREIVRALRVVCAPMVWEGVRASRIESSGNGVRVETSAGQLDAPHAVLAAGAWSSSIEIRVDGQSWKGPEAYPVRGHLFSCELPTGMLNPIVRHGHTYLVQRQSGLALVGATSEEVGFDRTVDAETVEHLRDEAARLIPAYRRAEIVERWTGFRPATRDAVPAIGRAGDSRLWLAYGHYRNGILMAPPTAARIVERIL
jgi:glycine oxidase